MSRPFVVADMLTSIDGKVMGNYMKTPEESANVAAYGEITETGIYAARASLCGAQTAEDDMTFGAAPDLDENAAPVPEGDFLAEHDCDGLNIVMDRKGRLGWQKNVFEYGEPSHIVSILTDRASNAYKDFLRRKGISYLICGEEDIDFTLMMEKIHDKLGVDKLVVSGPSVTWSLIRAGLVDELSVYIVPVADGSTEYPSLFMAREGLADDIPVTFDLLDVQRKGADGVWLRYKVKKVWDKQAFIDEFGIGRKDFEAER